MLASVLAGLVGGMARRQIYVAGIQCGRVGHWGNNRELTYSRAGLGRGRSAGPPLGMARPPPHLRCPALNIKHFSA